MSIDAGKRLRQRTIARSIWFTVRGTPLVIATAYAFTPPIAGLEEPVAKVHCRVMQNTLEQFVWFATCLLVLATYLQPQQARLIPILCVFFAAARMVYWWGYLRNGTLGRAPGVQLTFTLNIALLVGAMLAPLLR